MEVWRPGAGAAQKQRQAQHVLYQLRGGTPQLLHLFPPAEQAWIGWYAAAQGFTGYLRWAYNSWVQHPVQDSRFRTWPAGDTYQIYPGPLTSIRFEKLVEGIQAFEKVRLLRREFSRTGNQAKLAELDKVLAEFELEKLKSSPAAQMVEKAKSAINSL